MKQTTSVNALGFVAAMLLAGCAMTASTDPTRVENDFGNSVRQMVDGQIYDTKAARKPATEPPLGQDGAHTEVILRKHREHVGDPASVDDDVRVGVTQ